jgi:hypothetical protein
MVYTYKVLQTICQGWFRTVILLIAASWVARITGVGHQCPVVKEYLIRINWSIKKEDMVVHACTSSTKEGGS